MNASSRLTEAIAESLRRHNVRGKRIAIGLSGGIDSVVLAYLLRQAASEFAIELSALHVHHGLSPRADAWAAHCQRFCDTYRISLNIVRVRIDREAAGGIENAARNARYEAFRNVAADYLAVAQHIDDQAETVLHQMLRGTGLKGLAGMGTTRRLRPGLDLIRPLLGSQRRDIEAFAAMQALEWVDDESNADTALTRNFLRRELLPAIEARFPHYRESLARAARHAAEADDMLAALAAIDLRWDGVTGNAASLDGLPAIRQVNALYHWLLWQQVTPQSHRQLCAFAEQLFRAPPPDRPHQAGGHDFVIRRRNNVLSLQRK